MSLSWVLNDINVFIDHSINVLRNELQRTDLKVALARLNLLKSDLLRIRSERSSDLSCRKMLHRAVKILSSCDMENVRAEASPFFQRIFAEMDIRSKKALCAAREGEWESVKLLVAGGISFFTRFMILSIARSCQRWDVADFMLSSDDIFSERVNIAYDAAYDGRLDLAQKWLDRDHSDARGNVITRFAGSHRLDIVRELLVPDCPIPADDLGFAIFCAIKENQLDIVREQFREDDHIVRGTIGYHACQELRGEIFNRFLPLGAFPEARGYAAWIAGEDYRLDLANVILGGEPSEEVLQYAIGFAEEAKRPDIAQEFRDRYLPRPDLSGHIDKKRRLT